MTAQDDAPDEPRRGHFSFGAMLRGRCPRCGQGAIFQRLLGPRLLGMHPSCSVCGLEFERESGYFLGAMYISYGLGIGSVLPVSLFLVLVLGWTLVPVMLVMTLQTLVIMPLSFRWSRVIWLHVDHAFFPR